MPDAGTGFFEECWVVNEREHSELTSSICGFARSGQHVMAVKGSRTASSRVRVYLGALLKEHYASSQQQHSSLHDRLVELAETLARRIEEQKRSHPPAETLS